MVCTLVTVAFSFQGKQGKMKEAYQQAVMEAETGHVKKIEPIEISDTRSLKEKFEKGEGLFEDHKEKEQEDMTIFESGKVNYNYRLKLSCYN